MAAGDAQEQVTLEFDLNEDVAAALRRIEQRLESLDRQFEKSGITARASGHEMAEGVEELEEAADRAAGAQTKLGKSSEDLGGKTRKSKRDVDDHGSSLKTWAKSADSASKSLGGFGTVFKLFKFPVMIAGGMAAARMLTAVGGAGVAAIGNLAPMVGVLGPLAGGFLAAKAAMLVWKTASDALKPQLDAIKNDWKEVGKEVAAGGLAAGIDNLRTKTSQWTDVTAKGMTAVGKTIGGAANDVGEFSRKQDTLDTTARIWGSIDKVVHAVLGALIIMLPGALHLLDAMVGSTASLSGDLERGATAANKWLLAVTTSGRATNFFTRAAQMAKNMLAALWNVTVGVVNIFRIAGSTTGDLSHNMLLASQRFRAWTDSAAGKNSIRQFFLDIKPVVHELWLLLIAIVKGFASFGSDPSLAPLIAQVRTELLPALLAVLKNFSGPNGLLPALVDLVTNILRILANVDPQGLVLLAKAMAAFAGALAWCTENIPGFSQLLGLILTVVGFLAPLLWIGAKVLKVFEFLGPVFGFAAKEGEKLSASQKILKFVWEGLSKAVGWLVSGLKWVWDALGGAVRWVLTFIRSFGGIRAILSLVSEWVIGALEAIGTALLEMTPVGWVITIIVAIVALFTFLWFKCAWFRDAVKAVWSAIVTAALWCWDIIKSSAVAVWNWLGSVFTAIGHFFRDYVAQPIATAAMWLWENIIRPVASFIGQAFVIAFKVVWWIVRAVVYIIAAIILGLLWVGKQVWDGIVWAASTAWNWLYANVIAPIAGWIIARWTEVKLFFTVLWLVIVALATAAWNWLYANVISPVVDWIIARWNEIVGFFTWLWALIVALATVANLWIYNNIISPVVDWVKARWSEITAFFSWLWFAIVAGATMAWNFLYTYAIAPVVSAVMAVWNPLAGFFIGLWGVISGAAVAAWNGIRDAISAVGGAVKAVWDGIVNAVKGVYNWIADKWNSLPEIHVLGLDFAPPKLPHWLEGGYTAGKFGLAGEVGPEPIVRGSRVIGMAGANGPELGQAPRGSHIVPNPATLLGNPGLAKSLPASVAGAVSRALPGYAGLLDGAPHDAAPAPSAPAQRDSGSARLAGAVATLARSLDERPPPLAVSSTDPDRTERDVRRALERWADEQARRRRYDY